MSLPSRTLTLVHPTSSCGSSEPNSDRSARDLSGWPARRAEITRKINRLIVLYPDAVEAIEAVIDDYLDDVARGVR